MILRPFSLKKIYNSINTLSPKGLKKPTCIRLQRNKDKSSHRQRSLCSIDTNKRESSKRNRKMLSHRKLISASSLEQKENLTDRKCIEEGSRQRKKIVQSGIIDSNHKKRQQDDSLNRKRLHLNKYCYYRNDRLASFRNQETQAQNIQKVLEIKQNIIRQFIDRFQDELRQISQQKSCRRPLLTNRIKTENSKDQTTKKYPKKPNSLHSNKQTINLIKCITQQKQNDFESSIDKIDKTKFQQYVRQIKDNKKKDQKILILKNRKKSLQTVNLSRAADTQNITSRVSQIDSQNKKLNLKDLFKHSKKYEPYLKDSQTLFLNKVQITQIKQSQSKLEKSSLKPSPRKQKQDQNKESSTYLDCSSIQKLNQSSFISQIGRKSLLKHLQNQSIKIMKDQHKKTRKCLAKIKSIFPSDFF